MKEVRARDRSTPETLKLHDALRQRGVHSFIDKWDGHKHIDIAIPESMINIEIDGIQHNTSPQQALADLNRTYYSYKKGYFTLRIPNSLIRTNFENCLDLVLKIINDKKHNA